VLVLLLTMIGGFMTSLNIVREKEVGTIEQINVTPIKKWEFILGKLIPFWIIGMIVFSIGLLVIWGVYGIVSVGSIPLLYVVAGTYMVALLGFGLLVSTYCENQVQAMFVAFFFILIFILMSGLFTSVQSMPAWARDISAFAANRNQWRAAKQSGLALRVVVRTAAAYWAKQDRRSSRPRTYPWTPASKCGGMRSRRGSAESAESRYAAGIRTLPRDSGEPPRIGWGRESRHWRTFCTSPTECL